MAETVITKSESETRALAGRLLQKFLKTAKREHQKRLPLVIQKALAEAGEELQAPRPPTPPNPQLP